MTEKIVIAPVGKNMKALFTGLRDFPVNRIVLLSTEEMLKEAEKAKIALSSAQQTEVPRGKRCSKSASTPASTRSSWILATPT